MTTTTTATTTITATATADQVVPVSDRDVVRGLVARAQAGDAQAFGVLYDRYVGTIYQFVFFKVGQDRALAEDLTSETFLRALRRIDSFSWQGATFAGWLVTIARHLVVDHFRSGRTRKETLGTRLGRADGIAEYRGDRGDELSDVDRPAGPDTDPEARAVTHETNLALTRAVNRLPAEQRETVLLRFWLQLSVAECAQVLDISQSAVKSRQTRAMRALARAVPAENPRASLDAAAVTR